MLRKSSDPEVRKLRDQIELKPGMKINKLTLIKREGSSWVCNCDCGTTGVVITKAYRLKNEYIGDVQDHVGSCGCLQKKIFKQPNRKGSVETKYKDNTLGGLKILYRTDYINNNRSTIVVAQCPYCKKGFPTALPSTKTHCGCKNNKLPPTLEEYLLKTNYRSKQEEKIAEMLKENNISFVYDKSFQDCMDKSYLPFDFYVDNKYIIEFDGEQHFKDVGYFNYKKTKNHDMIKNQYCFKNNIPIIRIPYTAENDYTINDLLIDKTRFLLTPENQIEYYKNRVE